MLPTLQDPWEIISVDLEMSGSGSYREPDFLAAVRQKVTLLEQAIDDNWGDPFVMCDVDVQFFEPVETDLLCLIGSRDLIAQDDGPAGYCAGFYVAVANARVQKLARLMRRTLDTDAELSEQPVFNSAIEATSVFAGRLPERYFSPWQGTTKPTRWVPGTAIRIPDPIMMHHANWTVGVDNKLEQLQVVRTIVEERRTHFV